MDNIQFIYPRKMLPVWVIGIIALITLIAYVVTGERLYLFTTFLISFFGIILFFIFKNWHLEISDDKIVIVAPFYFRTYEWKDISSTYIKYRAAGRNGTYFWYFESASEKTSGFATNIFTKSQLKMIAEIVMNKCMVAKIDDKIKNISYGKFPWYFI